MSPFASTATATVIITVEVPIQAWSDEYDIPTDEVCVDAAKYLQNVIYMSYAGGQNLFHVFDTEASQ